MLLFLADIDTAEDKTKFESIYDAYNQMMYRAAYGILKDPTVAEDVVSKALFKIIRHLDKIRDVESVRTKRYILRIVESTAIDEYREAHRKQTVRLEEWEVHASYEEAFHDGTDVLDAINSLPVKYNVLFRMKYAEGYTDAEIAKRLGIPRATVRKRCERGKKKLEEILKERGLWEWQ